MINLRIKNKLKIAKPLLKEIKTCTECGKQTLIVGLNTGYSHELFPYMEWINFPCNKCPKCMQVCYNKYKIFYNHMPNRLCGWALEAGDEMACIKNLKDLDDYKDEGCYDNDIMEHIDCWIYFEKKEYMSSDHVYENDIVDLLEFFSPNTKKKIK